MSHASLANLVWLSLLTLSNAACVEVDKGIDDCAGVSSVDACRSAGCRPIVDDEGRYYECVDGNTDCGDDNACGSDGKRTAMFNTTCIPTGWTAIRHEECEVGCWLRSESECEQDERCTPIVDATNTYHECSVRHQCADAPQCAYDGDSRYALFINACLPNGWSYALRSKCQGDAGE